MSKSKKKEHPLDRIYNKLQDITAIAEDMAKEVKNRKNPDLAELAAEFKHVRYLREVWVGNVCHYTEELETAIVTAITGERREAA